MKLLNLGCGGNRPQDSFWWNMDNLRAQLKLGTPERNNLDNEPRYFDGDILKSGTPFSAESFDGILLQHVIEHFDCHEAVKVLKECKRILKPDGGILISVPDAQYFYDNHGNDCKERAVELFGEPIHDEGHEKFFTYALFRSDHKQVLTDTSLRCIVLAAGLLPVFNLMDWSTAPACGSAVMVELVSQLTRRQFSIEMMCANPLL